MRKLVAGLAAICTAFTLTACSNGSGKDAAPSRDEIVAGLNEGFATAIKETGRSAPAGLQEAMGQVLVSGVSVFSNHDCHCLVSILIRTGYQTQVKQ